jgi:hypothetical protein
MSKTSRTAKRHVLARAAFVAVAIGANAIPTAKTTMATTSYQVTVTCPIDGQPFTATLVGSYFQSGMRLDFKPVGSLIAPMPYPVCPGNGFVMYQDTFSESALSAIREIVASDEYRQLRSNNTDYFMVAYVKQRLGTTNHYDLGHTYLRASWEAERDIPELVDPYRRLARQAFDDFLRTERNRTEEWWTAAILATELDRLLVQFDTVEFRISILPLVELGARYPALKVVLDQILMHSNQRNSAAEQMYLPPRIGGTIGQAQEKATD